MNIIIQVIFLHSSSRVGSNSPRYKEKVQAQNICLIFDTMLNRQLSLKVIGKE